MQISPRVGVVQAMIFSLLDGRRQGPNLSRAKTMRVCYDKVKSDLVDAIIRMSYVDADPPASPLPRGARAPAPLRQGGRGMRGQPAGALAADPRARGVAWGSAAGTAPRRPDADRDRERTRATSAA